MINAFHPDYMKTHEPNFMKDFRTSDANRQAAEAVSKYVTKQRKVKPSHGTVFGISDKVTAATAPAHMHRRPDGVKSSKPRKMPMADVKQELADLLKRTEFRTYSRAGAK
jgi:hypothetical protein